MQFMTWLEKSFRKDRWTLRFLGVSRLAARQRVVLKVHRSGSSLSEQRTPLCEPSALRQARLTGVQADSANDRHVRLQLWQSLYCIREQDVAYNGGAALLRAHPGGGGSIIPLTHVVLMTIGILYASRIRTVKWQSLCARSASIHDVGGPADHVHCSDIRSLANTAVAMSAIGLFPRVDLRWAQVCLATGCS